MDRKNPRFQGLVSKDPLIDFSRIDYKYRKNWLRVGICLRGDIEKDPCAYFWGKDQLRYIKCGCNRIRYQYNERYR